MAIGAAVGIGAGMAAAGAGTAAAGIGVKGQAPKRSPYLYGGSDAARQGYLDQFGQQVQGAQASQQAAQYGLQQLQGTNNDNVASIQQLGQGLAANNATGGDAGMGYLQGYDPGAVVQQQARNAMQQQARMNTGMARGIGGGMAMRTAMNANAEGGVQTALGSGAAMGEARNQQALAMQQASVQQAQLNQQATGLNMNNAQAAANMQAQGMQFGQGYSADLYGQQQQLGMQREMGYVGAGQDIESQQLQAQMQYDQMRQQARMRKSDRLLALGGSLISGGGSLMASGMGK